MLSDLQKRKLTRHFEFYDIDSNGYIERDDYILFAERLARVRGWPVGTARYEMIVGRFLAEWEVLRSFADEGNDHRISLEEWYAYHSYVLFIDVKHRAGEKDIISTIFETLDANGDGFITESEFKAFYSIYDAPQELASEIFDRIDIIWIIARGELAIPLCNLIVGDNPITVDVDPVK
ncbi:MAG: hypothetical protein AAF125_00970, partial [Chloroflexota bacterium]